MVGGFYFLFKKHSNLIYVEKNVSNVSNVSKNERPGTHLFGIAIFIYQNNS